MVAIPGFQLINIYLSKVEKGAFCPDSQLGKLHLNINLGIVI